MKHGKMVVLEGIDGCGKTTHAKALVDVIPNALFLASPSWEGIGGHIREILTGKREHPGAWPLQMLFAVDRYQIEKDVLIPALKEGKTVLCDRWWYSGMAYGAYDGLVRKDIVTLYKQLATAPDLVLHLRVDPTVSVTREGKGGGKDLYDGNVMRQTSLSYLYDQHLEATYTTDAARLKKLPVFKRIDANRSLEDVRADVLQAINQH